MDAVGPATQQGIISTQIERVVNDRPTAAEPPRVQTREASPPPPPAAETGRGATVDTSA